MTNEGQIDVSIIIPVLHESDMINFLIDDIRNTTGDFTIEIIVVDGGEHQDTIKVITDQDVICITSMKGRGIQMNAGARIAQGSILVFLFADTKIPKNLVSEIDKVLQTGAFQVGSFRLMIDSERLVYKILSRFINFRSKVTRIPYGDQCIFLKKEYFEKVGGYKNILLMEDVDLMRRIKRAGDQIYIIPTYVRTSKRRWEKEGIIKCTIRNWMIRALYYLGIQSDILAKFYRPHKKYSKESLL